MNLHEALTTVFDEIAGQDDPGAVASYIPELARVDPDQFGVHLITVAGTSAGAGHERVRFSIQSIAKVFAVTRAYALHGESLWDRVGVEPSGTAFNSLVQLEADRGIPRNPFMNAGALVVCDVLLSSLPDAEADMLRLVRQVSGRADLSWSERIAASEKSAAYRNIALCNLLKSFGTVHNEPGRILDFYFKLCSLELDCRETAASFRYLAAAGVAHDGHALLTRSQTKRINALLQTCGLYDESGEFAFKVGLPGKSGVGGGIIAVHPGRYVLCTWSPRLNAKGNSIKGIRFLEQFTTATAQSIF